MTLIQVISSFIQIKMIKKLEIQLDIYHKGHS
jgi:hypothetical protein